MFPPTMIAKIGAWTRKHQQHLKQTSGARYFAEVQDWEILMSLAIMYSFTIIMPRDKRDLWKMGAKDFNVLSGVNYQEQFYLSFNRFEKVMRTVIFHDIDNGPESWGAGDSFEPVRAFNWIFRKHPQRHGSSSPSGLSVRGS